MSGGGGGAKEGPDYFGFFRHELEKLFSGQKGTDDDYFPFMGFKSRDEFDKDVNGTHESGAVKKLETLFCDGLGGELSDFRKERLKGLLKQSVSALTQEVDQMVEVVLATCHLQHQLKTKATKSSSQGSASGDNDGTHPSKKLTNSTSSENEESCAYCSVTQTSTWRRNPDGSRICNSCGLGLRKGTLQLLPEKKDGTIAGTLAEAGNKNDEVTDDLKFILDNDRELVERTMQKYVDEISSSLSNMEMQLEGILDNITAKCRNMTFFEKLRLYKMMKDLPPKNFDRVVEIIKHGEGLDQHEAKDILVDLEDMGNPVLWRLYYYAKAVENARRLLA